MFFSNFKKCFYSIILLKLSALTVGLNGLFLSVVSTVLHTRKDNERLLSSYENQDNATIKSLVYQVLSGRTSSVSRNMTVNYFWPVSIIARVPCNHTLAACFPLQRVGT